MKSSLLFLQTFRQLHFIYYYFTGPGMVEKAIQPISAELVKFIERSTKDQTASGLWNKLHEYRITSSIFGDVYHSTEKCASLKRRIVEHRYSQ
jgi:hypothetical protein